MKTLGLDLGTNSIGWAVVEKLDGERELVAKGVHVFPKGVGEGKAGEYSLANERTGYRSARRLKYRRKLRKLAVLKVLGESDYCPALSQDELKNWRRKKIYPENQEFRQWLLTDDDQNKNPYYFRNLAAEMKLDLNDQKSRYLLGRAFYHLAQRRGFKSNALEINDEETGKVKEAIKELQERKGALTLGQFLYKEFYGIHGKVDKNGKLERIRNRYTDRENDYLHEFDFICEKQQIPDSLKNALRRELFFQRPLKSQKNNVGKCPFEPDKKRIPVSHPMFERFRMFQFINNIKIKAAGDEEMRFLNKEERAEAEKAFYVNDSFKFEKIAKRLCPAKAKIAYLRFKKSPENFDYLFNYRPDNVVPPCGTINRLMNVFGCSKDFDSLLEVCKNNYAKNEGKTALECLIDIWHVLFTFDDNDKRIEFGEEQLGLPRKEAEKFAKIKLPQDYAQLSYKAIKKFMPLLENGLQYSRAAFLANIPQVLKKCGEYDSVKLENDIVEIIDKNRLNNQIIDAVNALIKRSRDDSKPWNYDANSIAKYKDFAANSLKKIVGLKHWEKLDIEKKAAGCDEIINVFEKQQGQNASRKDFLTKKTIQSEIYEYLKKNYGVGNNELELLYHPSAIETYPQAEKNDLGVFQLGNPQISAIKNPVFMRTMHRLRALVNELLKQRIIDPDTRINIEMARELNDANMRKAIERQQRENENKRKKYREHIEEFYKEKNISRIPSDADILKCQLWEEQKRRCPYTFTEIGIEDFLGANPKYDIEHTFPRSRTCDNSQANLTLSDRTYNRKVKRGLIPAELPDYDKIKLHVDAFGWADKIENLEKQMHRINPGSATTKEQKDNSIAKKHKLGLEKKYWKDKLFRFNAVEVPDKFVSRQLVDTRVICKYAKMYLETVFNKVFSYKALALKPFYKAWGIAEKSRDTQLHHCVDAIIAACLDKSEYEKIAQYYHEHEDYTNDKKPEPDTIPPWNGFSYYINKELAQEVIVNCNMADKVFRKGQKPIYVNGVKKVAKGDSVRGVLHKETFYGAVDDGGKIRHTVRKKLEDLKVSDINNIVDPAVREIILANTDKIGKETIWMNEDKKIPICKVKVYTRVNNPVCLKEHTHKSAKEHKLHYRVKPGDSYALAIYGEQQGLVKGSKKINIHQAAVKRKREEPMFPKFNKKNVPLRAILKKGSNILLYENSPDELKKLSQSELVKRLYVLYGIEGNNTCNLRLHLEARASQKGQSSIDFQNPEGFLRMSLKKVLVEGYDFKLDILGNIEFMEE